MSSIPSTTNVRTTLTAAVHQPFSERIDPLPAEAWPLFPPVGLSQAGAVETSQIQEARRSLAWAERFLADGPCFWERQMLVRTMRTRLAAVSGR